MKKIALLLSVGLSVGCSRNQQSALPIVHATRRTWHTPPDKWNQPRLYHSPFEPAYEDRITLGRVPAEQVEAERNLSLNHAYWCALREPDRTKPGPWTAELFIFTEREYLLRLVVTDYKVVKPRWINQKLLYIEVWWGRILGTYLIVDVEAEAVIIKEMIHDGLIVFQQWQQARKQK